MKKILFIALLLIVPFIGFSQTTKPIDGFLGIKFGSSRAEVTEAMKAKGAVLNPSNNVDGLYFTNVTLGDQKSRGCLVLFFNDKAYEANFLFRAEVDDKSIDFYTNLVNEINGVYGSAESHKVFKSTFHDGDGYEITAIQQGDADYYTYWHSDKNFINAHITVKLAILVAYVDGPLSEQATAGAKSNF
jgi:hypothetical protein